MMAASTEAVRVACGFGGSAKARHHLSVGSPAMLPPSPALMSRFPGNAGVRDHSWGFERHRAFRPTCVVRHP
jgi:hypothetical protein